jgi:TolB protein
VTVRGPGFGAVLAGCLLAALAGDAHAQEGPSVVVTPGGEKAYKIAVQRFAEPSGGSGGSELARALREEIVASLEFSSLFKAIDPAAFLGGEVSAPLEGGPPLVCTDWTQIGADALAEGELSADRAKVSAEFRVWDAQRCQKLARKRYKGDVKDLRRIGKRIADDIVEAFTGRAGVAATELAFISTRTGTPEVWIAEPDGANLRRATTNKSVNNFPNWAPDGNTILYTSYRSGDLPGLFLLVRGGTSPGKILKGLAGGAQQYRGVFDPSGSNIAVVVSMEGGSEIFRVRRDGGGSQRLTNNRSIDVAPSWSPDGRQIAFVSDRGGAPQIFLMDSDGSNQRRLTFNGGYNTAPAWSPDGRWIVYESRVGGQFDLWLIDPEGQTNYPLVEHGRNDQGPAWSPDSRKIAFSSNRRGRYDLYVMDVDGGNLRRVTEDGGENSSVAWGPYPR